MEIKFTKGGWGLVYTKNKTIEVRSDRCVLICEIDLSNEINNPTPVGAVANAKLIAAAPLMLQALAEWQEANALGDANLLCQARISRDIAIKKATE